MDHDRAADFVRRFAEFWQAPAIERLGTVLAPDARLSAPMVPTTSGLEAGKRAFADLFELIPDMTTEVHRWGATSDGVLIELTVRGTAGGGPISWQTVDRFVLDENGLATERFTYFDSLPLALTLARRPRTWRWFARSRIKQLGVDAVWWTLKRLSGLDAKGCCSCRSRDRRIPRSSAVRPWVWLGLAGPSKTSLRAWAAASSRCIPGRSATS